MGFVGLCGLKGIVYGCVGCRGLYGNVWGFMVLCEL